MPKHQDKKQVDPEVARAIADLKASSDVIDAPIAKDPRSPIDRLCDEFGYSLTELSIAASVRYQDLHHARAGRIRLPRRLLDLAVSQGYDRAALQAENEAFIAARRTALVERLNGPEAGR